MSKELSARNDSSEISFSFEYDESHLFLFTKKDQALIDQILRMAGDIKRNMGKTSDLREYIIQAIKVLNLYEIGLGISSQSGAIFDKKDGTVFKLQYENKDNYEKLLKLSANATAEVNRLLKNAKEKNAEVYNYFQKFLEEDEARSYSYVIMKKRIHEALISKTNFPEALRFCEENELYLNIAINHLRKKDYRWAIFYAERAIENRQNADLAYMIKGQAYLKQNDREQAKENFLYSFNQYQNFYALLDYYRCLKNEDINAAARIFADYETGILKITDKNLVAEFYYEKGLLCEKLNDDEQAYKSFSLAFLKNKESSKIRLAIIKCLLYGKGCAQDVDKGMKFLDALTGNENSDFNALILKADINENGIKKKSAQAAAAAAASEEYAIPPNVNEEGGDKVLMSLCLASYAPAYEKMAHAYKVGNFRLTPSLIRSLLFFLEAANLYRKENDLENFTKIKNEILHILQEDISLNNYSYDNHEQKNRDLYLRIRELGMPEAGYFYAKYLQRNNANQDDVIRYYIESLDAQGGVRSVFAAHAYYDLGQIYFARNDPKSALKYFDRAIALNEEYSAEPNLADARFGVIERRAGIVAQNVFEQARDRYLRESQTKIELPTAVDYSHLLGETSARNINEAAPNNPRHSEKTENNKPAPRRTRDRNPQQEKPTKPPLAYSDKRLKAKPYDPKKIQKIISQNAAAQKSLAQRMAAFDGKTAAENWQIEEVKSITIEDYFRHYQQHRDILSKYVIISYLVENFYPFGEVLMHVEELLTTHNTTAGLTQEDLADFTKLLARIFSFKVEQDVASYSTLNEDTVQIRAALNFVELTKNALLETQPRMDEEKAKIFDEAHLQLRKTLNKAIEEINFTRSFNNIADDNENLQFQQHMAHKGIAASQYYCALAYKNGKPEIGLEPNRFLFKSYLKDLLDNNEFKDSPSYQKAQKFYSQETKPSTTTHVAWHSALDDRNRGANSISD